MAPADNWKRALANDSIWEHQWASMGEDHVAPLNDLVLALGAAKGGVRLPFAAP